MGSVAQKTKEKAVEIVYNQVCNDICFPSTLSVLLSDDPCPLKTIGDSGRGLGQLGNFLAVQNG